MTKIALLGSAIVATALLCGAAQAQDYYNGGPAPAYSAPTYGGDTDNRAYDNRTYDNRGYQTDAYNGAPETVIVHPYYDRVYKQQHLGRVNGEINPTEYALSQPVNFTDLDLSRRDGRRELRFRIEGTARDLCARLDRHIPAYLNDEDSARECVRTATNNAMRDVYDR